MTAQPVTVGPTALIGELAQKMVDAHIHRVVVVVDESRPQGIVTSTDVLAAVARGPGSRAEEGKEAQKGRPSPALIAARRSVGKKLLEARRARASRSRTNVPDTGLGEIAHGWQTRQLRFTPSRGRRSITRSGRRRPSRPAYSALAGRRPASPQGRHEGVGGRRVRRRGGDLRRHPAVLGAGGPAGLTVAGAVASWRHPRPSLLAHPRKVDLIRIALRAQHAAWILSLEPASGDRN